MTNAERQRQFRESHPGYFGRYRVNHRKAVAAAKAALAAANAAANAAATTDAPMLPAPGEMPVIPAMNVIAAPPFLTLHPHQALSLAKRSIAA
jgi:hypothetical protein